MQQSIKITLLVVSITTLFFVYNNHQNEELNSSQVRVENKSDTLQKTNVTKTPHSTQVSDPFETIENSLSNDSSEVDPIITDQSLSNADTEDLAYSLNDRILDDTKAPDITNTKITGDIIPKEIEKAQVIMSFDGDESLGGIVPKQ